MKNLKTILFLSLLLCNFSFSEEEEEPKTIEKDGSIYKINSSSLNITPYSGDNTIMETSKDTGDIEIAKSKESKSCSTGCLKSCCAKSGCDLTFSAGTIIPIGDARDGRSYDPGSSLSIQIPTKWNFDLLGKIWDIKGEAFFGSISGVDGNEDITIMAGIAHFNPSFEELPVDIGFGLGLSRAPGIGGLSACGLVDVNYKLPFENHDLTLGFKYLQFVDVNSKFEMDFGMLKTYGFNLNYTKSL